MDLPGLRLPSPLAGVRMRFSPVVFVLFALACFAWNYPGQLNVDSVEQLVGMADPRYLNDWHSPLVGWIWTLAAPWLGEPAAATAVHSLLLAFFAATVPVQRGRSAFERSLTGFEILLKLSLLTMAGTILKDIMLAALLLGFLACLQLVPNARRPRAWLGGAALFLALALTVRPPNFLMAVFAIALFMALYVRSARAWAAWVAPLSAILALALPVAAGINAGLFHAENGHAEKQLILFDAAAIAAATGKPVFEELPGWPKAGLPPPAACYEVVEWDSLAPWGRCPGYSAAFDTVEWQHGRRTTFGWWARAILRHPAAYARHRLAFALYTIGPATSLSASRVPPPLNSEAQRTDLRRVVGGRMDERRFQIWIDRTPSATAALDRALVSIVPWLPGLALAACLGLFAGAVRARRAGRRWDLTAALAAAFGLGNAAMLTLTGVSSSERYMLPAIVLAAAGLIAAGRFRAQEASKRAA
ncbi:MAG TPA: hypothetical protein VGD66_03925 [Allosphingosinicella sp.]|jgi:hypothetical protein